MSWKVTNIESFPTGSDIIVTVEIKTLWFKPRTATFFGSCTVWHQWPSARRCNTETEYWLANVWTKWRDGPKVAQVIAARQPPSAQADGASNIEESHV